jgi:hypothetical protein
MIRCAFSRDSAEFRCFTGRLTAPGISFVAHG